MIEVRPHPWLDAAAFLTRWPAPLGQCPIPDWIDPWTDPAAEVGLPGLDEERRRAVRDLLRHSGFKPSGRNKPCNEYIRSAALAGRFPRVNLAVDLTNVAVLHSGLPISVIERPDPPWWIGPAGSDARIVFNPSGQIIALGGLLCLHDATGPCANPVKDALRTRTSDQTTETLTIVWGTTALPSATDEAVEWLTLATGRLGGRVDRVSVGVDRG